MGLRLAFCAIGLLAIAAGGARHIIDGVLHPGAGMTANDVEIIARPQMVLRESLRGSVELARAAGVPDDRIIVDPGIGFGKTREEIL